ncbi:MAG: hypothetical protein KatS3mg105_2663 [Gemmatales bacterium]|nr:MAG: hypothetical protein KatS3mg105_2663 [Gemmatales bacterium]
MFYSMLADVIVVIHVAYVGFVIVGQLLIVGGALLRWQWVRNFWFRVCHLVAILIVAYEALAGIVCPLTVWEDELRRMAGQTVEEGSFIGRFMHSILFYDLEPWIFTVCYVAFALLVLGTFVLVPPRWRRRQEISDRAASQVSA